MTILAMHQPNFLPWCGFFEKMRQSGIFVLLDDVHVPRGGSYANRTRILTPDGVQWLTLPVYEKGKRSYNRTLFNELILEKLQATIRQNYNKATFVGEFSLEHFVGISNLAYFNIGLIYAIAKYCQIKTQVSVQFHTGVTSSKDTLAIDLCKHFGADVYLSGTGAKSYNKPEQFEKNGIELRYLDYKEQPYKQLWTDKFIPGLSVIDRLFNTGAIC